MTTAVQSELVRSLLKVLKGASTGLTYGVKIRFTHSIVISILFGSGPFLKRLTSILQMTGEHAGRLAAFVGVYKAVVLVLENSKGKAHPLHALLAGLVGGILLFRTKTVVTVQIMLYLLPRVLTGASKLLMLRSDASKNTINRTFPFLSMLCWGLVMWLFEENSRLLQPSLTKTMQKLYKDSDSWRHWTEFVPFGQSFQALLA